MDNKNTALWDSLAETPPSATKKALVGGRAITSINGLYVVRRATEAFGPVGLGWGYEIVGERLDDTFPIFDAETKEQICIGKTHTILIKLWYIADGKRCEISHFGHTKYIYKSRHGATADEEAPKKSLTDALKKCLSMVGVCADIFMGQFDDADYVAAMTDKETLDNADNRADGIAKQARERDEWLANAVRLIGESKTEGMLKGLFSASIRKAKARNDSDAIKTLTSAKDAAKLKLAGTKKSAQND